MKKPYPWCFLFGSILLNLVFVQNSFAQAKATPCSKSLLAINTTPGTTAETPHWKMESSKKDKLTPQHTGISNENNRLQYQDLEFGQLPASSNRPSPIMEAGCCTKKKAVQTAVESKDKTTQPCKGQQPTDEKIEEDSKRKKIRRVRPSATVKLVTYD